MRGSASRARRSGCRSGCGMRYVAVSVWQTRAVPRPLVQAYLAKSAVPADPLTPREREVLQLVAEGKTTKEAAKLLGISAKTVESHRTRIMKKLDTPNTAGIVRYAIRSGLTQV